MRHFRVSASSLRSVLARRRSGHSPLVPQFLDDGATLASFCQIRSASNSFSNQRSEQALVATLAEMYVQGVSTRKVKAITEELCGHAFTGSAISAINKRLDESLEAFAGRPLEKPFAYLILDARYEKVREGAW